MRRVGLTLAFALLLAGASATGALAGSGSSDGDPRLDLRVSSHGETVRATPGSHCLHNAQPGGGGGGMCADYVYPLPSRGRLSVHREGVVIAKLGARATSLDVELRRYDGDRRKHVNVERVEQVDDAGRRWRIHLPRDFRGARRLGVFADYRDGDADFEAALAVHRHGS